MLQYRCLSKKKEDTSDQKKGAQKVDSKNLQVLK